MQSIKRIQSVADSAALLTPNRTLAVVGTDTWMHHLLVSQAIKLSSFTHIAVVGWSTRQMANLHTIQVTNNRLNQDYSAYQASIT